MSAVTDLIARAEAAEGAGGLPSVPPALFSGFLYGLTLSNNGSDATNDIDIAAGSCIDSTNAVLMTLSALTKRLDAGWAAGTNQGMRNSAASIADTTYHIYAVCKAGGADTDIYAHASADVATVLTALQAETGGADYLYARRIGSIIRASSAIRLFKQAGDNFILDVPVNNYNQANPGTSAVTQAGTVPAGIEVELLGTVSLVDATPASASVLYISALTQTDNSPEGLARFDFVTAAAGAGVPARTGGRFQVRTNTSGQYRSRVGTSDADVTLLLATRGWIDTRGRLG